MVLMPTETAELLEKFIKFGLVGFINFDIPLFKYGPKRFLLPIGRT